MTLAESHKALRILLLAFSIIAVLVGLVMLFCSAWIVSVAPASLQFTTPALLIVLVKFFGILTLTGAYLSYVTSRDPVRYAAFIDGFAFLLVAAAAIDIYALFTLHVEPFYPAKYVLARTVVRLALAVVLIVLRPRANTVQSPP